MLVRLLGGLAGVRVDKVDAALEAYFGELSHARYAQPPVAKPAEEDETRRRLAAVGRLNSVK